MYPWWVASSWESSGKVWHSGKSIAAKFYVSENELRAGNSFSEHMKEKIIIHSKTAGGKARDVFVAMAFRVAKDIHNNRVTCLALGLEKVAWQHRNNWQMTANLAQFHYIDTVSIASSL